MQVLKDDFVFKARLRKGTVTRMEVNINIMYEDYFIPTKGNRMGKKDAYAEITGTIREVSEDKLSRAFTVKARDYYYYRGKLYTLATVRDIAPTDSKRTPLEELKELLLRSSKFYYNRSDENKSKPGIEKKVSEYLNNFIIVNRQLYVARREPIYHVSVFGLGDNHGGTQLAVEELGIGGHDGWFFNALQGKETMDTALKIAQSRGDTESLSRIRNLSPIVIHDAKYVKFKPKNKRK